MGSVDGLRRFLTRAGADDPEPAGPRDPGLARAQAYIFAAAGISGFVVIAFPHPEVVDEIAAIPIGAFAILTGIALYLLADRIPAKLLIATPALGTLCVTGCGVPLRVVDQRLRPLLPLDRLLRVLPARPRAGIRPPRLHRRQLRGDGRRRRHPGAAVSADRRLLSRPGDSVDALGDACSSSTFATGCRASSAPSPAPPARTRSPACRTGAPSARRSSASSSGAARAPSGRRARR